MATDVDKKNKALPWALGVVVLLLVAAVATAVALLRDRRTSEPGDPYDTPYARMHDPEYLKQIDKMRAEQNEVAKRLMEGRAALDAAKEKGEDSQEYRDALAKMEAAIKDFNINRVNSQLVVRDRIMRENNAIKAKQEASKQKGE